MLIQNKTILLDVDGVLADFVGSLLKECGTDLLEANIDEWDMFSMMKSEHRAKAFKTMEDSSFWRNLPLMPHAQHQVEDFRRNDNKVIFVTSPWGSDTKGWECHGWGHARAHWLREHFNASFRDVIIANQKQYVQGDLLIDDRYKNIMDWADMNQDGQGWLVERPYNKDMIWSHRIKISESGWEFNESD